MKPSLRAAFALWTLVSASVPAAAQLFDRSGNGMLKGNYLFREVIWLMDGSGDLVRALVAYGTINFDGRGNYSVVAAAADSATGLVLPCTTASNCFALTGTYSISASGYGFIQHPLASGTQLAGTVSNGVFIGSTPDGGFNDLFMAVQAFGATNANFQGAYTLAYLNYPTGRFEDNYAAVATIAPDAQGNIGNVNLKYYIASAGTNPATQTETGVRATFSQGVGTLAFPTTAQLVIRGNQSVLLSPDGNFFFGGSVFQSNLPIRYDFMIGVRRGAPAPFAGLYYLAGVNQSFLGSSQVGETDTYFGALQAGGGTIIGHQRFFSVRQGEPINYTYTDAAPGDPFQEYVNEATSTEYYLSADGAFRIGFGQGPFLGLSVAVRAPVFSGSGVFLNPAGVVNGASSAPFTAGIAPGELLTLYGSGLANTDLRVADTLPLPTTLAGVQVLINNRPAPIYYVGRSQIAAVVPYGTTEAVAQVQVVNNGVSSNAVTLLVYPTAPGVFSIPPGGAGYGAVLHPDYTLVTPDHPARAGEVLQVYLTGLGQVFPTIQDGAPGPVGQLARVQEDVGAYVDGQPAEVLYAGLAPTLPALYQVNLKVPDGAGSGDAYLEIAGPGAFTSQVLLPVAGQAAASRAAESAKTRRR
jgi:uncharacterized protein (TIGR03437 family)